MFGWAYNNPNPPRLPAKHDPRLDPIDGDDIDELVNEQLARGMDSLR